jgi:transcriptional regulator with PAS, ATPase and Fis domain
LRNYDWTGDTAQLKQVINAVVTNTPDKTSVIETSLLKTLLPETVDHFVPEQLFSRFDSLDNATDVFQREYLTHLLKKYQYDTLQLAEFLNIPVDALRSRIHQLNIL